MLNCIAPFLFALAKQPTAASTIAPVGQGWGRRGRGQGVGASVGLTHMKSRGLFCLGGQFLYIEKTLYR